MFAVYLLFLATAVRIQQDHIVLLQCTVLIFLFYLHLLRNVQHDTTNNDANHTMIGTFILSASYLCLLTFKIATVLILEYATILFASPSHPTREEAFNKACSQFISSSTHDTVNNQQFPLSTEELTEFILTHRLH